MRITFLLGLAFFLFTTACGIDEAQPVSNSEKPQGMGMDWGDDDDDDDTGTNSSGTPEPAVTFLGEISVPGMKAPNRIAVAPSGNIIVADTQIKKVHVFAPRGTLRFSIDGFRYPLGVTVDGQGKIYVGDEGLELVKIFNPDGSPSGMLGLNGPTLSKPGDIAWCAQNDSVYVVDSKANSILVYKAGVFEFAFGGPGTNDGQFDFPTGIVCDSPNNRIYISDHTNSRVQVFDMDGEFVSVFGNYGGGQGEFNRPQGVALDAQERLYVVDAYQGRLQVVDTNGIHLSYIGEYGTDPGQMILPLDAVLDSYNRLLVTSYKTGKILVFGVDDYSDSGLNTICGDGNVDTVAFETCDDGNAVTETCPYGETSCEVCNGNCEIVSGATSFCGNGVLDASNGEECDNGTSNSDQEPGTCHVNCKMPLLASIKLKPDKLKLKKNNKVNKKRLNVFIELPDGQAVDILPETVKLSSVLIPDSKKKPKVKDHDKNGILDMKLKFKSQDLLPLLTQPVEGEHVLVLTGLLSNGKDFYGTAILQISSK